MELTPDMEAGHPHFEVEREKMGSRRVYIHLLVPTLFGLHQRQFLEERKACVLCGNSMESTRNRIHQLWVRIMGGIHPENEALWEYSVVFEPVCGSCRSSDIPHSGLLVIQREHLQMIDDFIFSNAFENRNVEIQDFLNVDGVFGALADTYLWRLTLINSLVPQLCAALFGRNKCFLCRKEAGTRVCPQCKALFVCKECETLFQERHAVLCAALKAGRVFQTDPQEDRILFIERSERGQPIRYQP